MSRSVSRGQPPEILGLALVRVLTPTRREGPDPPSFATCRCFRMLACTSATPPSGAGGPECSTPSKRLRFDADELIDAGGDRVVLANHGMGRGRGSGARVEMQFSTVLTLCDRKIVKLITYNEHAEALRAAGLAE